MISNAATTQSRQRTHPSVENIEPRCAADTKSILEDQANTVSLNPDSIGNILNTAGSTAYLLYQQNLHQLSEYYAFHRVAEQYNRLLFGNLLSMRFEQNADTDERVAKQNRTIANDHINHSNNCAGNCCNNCQWLHNHHPNGNVERTGMEMRRSDQYSGTRVDGDAFVRKAVNHSEMSAPAASGDKLYVWDSKVNNERTVITDNSRGDTSPVSYLKLLETEPPALFNGQNSVTSDPGYGVNPPCDLFTPMPEKVIPLNVSQYLVIGQPTITATNIISLVVNHHIRVDITVDHSVRVVCFSNRIAAVIGKNGVNCGLIHPCGSVLQEGLVSHIVTGTRMAKIFERGITFTSQNRSLVYFVDRSGCKSTTERFRKMDNDFTTEVFYDNTLSGEFARQRAISDVSRHTHDTAENGKGDEVWHIGGIQIRHKPRGEVLVSKLFGKYIVHLSPLTGEVKMTTPFVRIAITFQAHSYFQIIAVDPRTLTESKVIASHNKFRVKYGSQQAGFDSKDQLVLL